MDLVISCADQAGVLVCLTNVLQFGAGGRGKACVVDKFCGTYVLGENNSRLFYSRLSHMHLLTTDIIPQLYALKPLIIQKHAIPTALKLLADPKSDIKTATTRLVQTLFSCMGEGLFEFVAGEDGRRVREICG